MAIKKTLSLRDHHPETPEMSLNNEYAVAPLAAVLESYYEKFPALRDIHPSIIRDAWFTKAHLLLKPGSLIADMGCFDGMMTYAMAVLNPHLRFVGIGFQAEPLQKAINQYQLPNLSFIYYDGTQSHGLEENSLDAIINSFTLHEIYSDSRYDERTVVKALEKQFKYLRPEGLIFIRDFAMPERNAYVLLEMPDTPSRGKDVADLSEADLLVHFSECARPKEDPGCTGFYLEEMPPRFPQTRLFRLSSKWAYEFILRKDHRSVWEEELSIEYTFFTQHDFRKNLRNLGARVIYTTPHWDDRIVRENFTGHFRMLDEEYNQLGAPSTSFIAVAQKMGENMSLRLLERRPAQKTLGQINIKTMRNEVNGRLVEIINRDFEVTEILPYRVTEDGRLNIIVHEGKPRGIVNAVPRQGRNIDQKTWSGHMIEAIAVDTNLVNTIHSDNIDATAQFAQEYLGIIAGMGCGLEYGQVYYPAPEFIEERIPTRYLRYQDHDYTNLQIKHAMPDADGFTTNGRLREVDAQGILNAISVGFLPNSRLELQIVTLADALGIRMESWMECPLALPLEEFPDDRIKGDLIKVAKNMATPNKPYRPTRGTANQLRSVQSIFVDQSYNDGALRGVKSCEMEFVIPDDDTTNVAAILPLNRHAITGEMVLALVEQNLPVPQRFNGSSTILTAPSFKLPRDIKNIDDARYFVAEKFNVKLNRVIRLGESYYTHIGMTPQRVFPFAVAGYGGWGKAWNGGATALAPVRRIRRMMWWDFDETLMWMTHRAMLIFGDDMEMSLDREHRQEMTRLLREGPHRDMSKLVDVMGMAGMTAEAPAPQIHVNSAGLPLSTTSPSVDVDVSASSSSTSSSSGKSGSGKSSSGKTSSGKAGSGSKSSGGGQSRLSFNDSLFTGVGNDDTSIIAKDPAASADAEPFCDVLRERELKPK
jgi:ubiquinone/menaquinone biosynthesis C-methylase UbiE/uncharacterized membrane protein YgcG